MNTQEKIFAILRELAAYHETLRIGQIIYNATSGADIFYFSDGKLLRLLEEYKKEHHTQ